jgi:hypothetical protein
MQVMQLPFNVVLLALVLPHEIRADLGLLVQAVKQTEPTDSTTTEATADVSADAAELDSLRAETDQVQRLAKQTTLNTLFVQFCL